MICRMTQILVVDAVNKDSKEYFTIEQPSNESHHRMGILLEDNVTSS